MKKKVLKDWVVYGLISINLVAFLFMNTDCDNLGLYIVSHLIALIIFIINSMLVIKYGDLHD